MTRSLLPVACRLAAAFVGAAAMALGQAAGQPAAPAPSRAAGEPADLTKPVQVFVLLGQSNMVGFGKVAGAEGSLTHAVREKARFPYLVDDAGAWRQRRDVRYVRWMQGRGLLDDDWLVVKPGTIGPEHGIGHALGDALDAPVLLIKCCIGNRSLGWDLLPPGSERYEFEGRVHAGYGERPDSWPVDPDKGLATPAPPWLGKDGKPVQWHAGKQYDDDVAAAKQAIANLAVHYPGARTHEVAGFFFWQGEKDVGNKAHASRYEHNLVRFVAALRKDFDAPGARFVLATLGEAQKGGGGNGGLVLDAQLAVDGAAGKHPEFAGNVATVYTHPLSLGGSGNSHYNGNAETYMNVGEAMGKAMVELLRVAK